MTGVAVPEKTASEIDVINVNDNAEAQSDVVLLRTPASDSKNKRKHASRYEKSN